MMQLLINRRKQQTVRADDGGTLLWCWDEDEDVFTSNRDEDESEEDDEHRDKLTASFLIPNQHIPASFHVRKTRNQVHENKNNNKQ